MRNLYIIHKSSRGSLFGIGTHIATLIKCIEKMGIRITVVTLNDGSVEETTVEMRHKVRYIQIPNPIYFPLDSQAYQISVGWLLKEFVDEEDENIFHLHRMDLKSLASVLKHNFSGRVILTVHYSAWSLTLAGDKKRLSRLLSRPANELPPIEKYVQQSFGEESELMNHYCDKIIAISKHSLESQISIYKVNPDKVILIPNALKDTYRPISRQRKQTLKQKFHIDSGDRVIIFAGRLDEVKGIHFLVHAFKQILSLYPNTRLILAGDGDLPPVFQSSRYLWNKITFTGFISRRDLYQLYSIADIGVVPSLHEEFGYVAIEMMMHKVPIVVNRTTGLQEIVRDGIDGMHVNLHPGRIRFKESVNDLTNKLILLLQDSEAARKMAYNARKIVLRQYNMERFETQIQALYNQEFSELDRIGDT